MSILGIVAEYDPFHWGHARHLALAREQVHPDFTYIALSGCFRQRGDLALLSPYDRAEAALRHGADAIFALPAAWTLRDAEHYALGAVDMLRRLGVTHLAFGAETEDLAALRGIAETLENPTEGFQKLLRKHLDAGEGLAKARSLAMEELCPEWGKILETPNNILGICYLRAIHRLDSEIQPVLIPRQGGYHADRIDPAQPSASAIAEALRRGNCGEAYAAMPEEMGKTLRKRFLSGTYPKREIYDILLMERLRSMTREEIALLPDCSEGLGDLLLKSAKQARTLAELLDLVSGRRYPRARVRRLCAWALLGDPGKIVFPEKAVLMGLRRDPAMTARWKAAGDFVSSDFQDPVDLRAWQIWAQCAGLPDTLPWTEKMRTI